MQTNLLSNKRCFSQMLAQRLVTEDDLKGKQDQALLSGFGKLFTEMPKESLLSKGQKRLAKF